MTEQTSLLDIAEAIDNTLISLYGTLPNEMSARVRMEAVASVLASEGVVDPVEYAEGLVSLARENKCLEQQLDAIRAEAKEKQ